MDPRSDSELSEICNDKVLFVTKYKVAFSIFTVISYDSVVLTLITENYKKTYFPKISGSTTVKIQG